MQVDMAEFAAHTSSLLREAAASGESFLVTRRKWEPVIAVMPTSEARHEQQVGMRELSRGTHGVVRRLRRVGRPVTVTSHGRAVAEIQPLTASDERRYAAAIAAQSVAFVRDLERADRDLDERAAVTLDDDYVRSLPASKPLAGLGSSSRSSRKSSRSSSRSATGRSSARSSSSGSSSGRSSSSRSATSRSTASRSSSPNSRATRKGRSGTKAHRTSGSRALPEQS